MAWPTQKSGSATARGYGWEHQQEKARLLPLAYGQLCPYWGVDPKCPGPMLHGQQLHLDHIVPRALGGRTGGNRIAHGDCNQRAGSRLAHRLRGARQRISKRSRDW